MSTIQFGGVVSGLNTQGIIDALVAAEKQPLTTLQKKEATLTSQKAAYSQLGTAIDALISQVKNFTVTSAGAARTATSADSSIFTATAASSTPVATYQVSIDRLATATKAASTGAIGAPVTGSVDTSKMLAEASLGTAVTAGQMAITIDGTTIQYAVGDPETTTMQSVMDGLASAVQAQMQAGGDSATVTASIVNGQVQLQIGGNTLSHDVSFGDTGDTSNLATAFGLDTQGVTGQQNATITGTSYLDPVLSSLNLPGSVTAGQISAVVDGVIVHYTVGDPAHTSLTQLLTGFAAAIQSQFQAGGANQGPDATATVTASVVDNKLQLAVTGAGLTHSLSFGAAGDASNALAVLGISTASASGAANPTLTGTTNLGVVRTGGTLDSAGLTGLTSTTTGVLSINGIDINYDTTVNSLATVISRINNSGAGVIASVDRTNDKLILTRKETGSLAIDLQDSSGTLGAALKLAPGTTNAQTLGSTAQVTVDGRTVVSTSNSITNAIDGVVIKALKVSPLGEAQSLTVGVDQSAIQTSLNSFVSSFNSLADTLDNLTSTTPGTAGGTAGTSGPLATDATARSMLLSLRDLLFQVSGTGSINSLGAIGLNTGSIGSLAGTTNRLQIDTTALTAALNQDSGRVASLLDSSSGPMAALLSRLKSYQDPSNTNAYIQAHTAGLSSEISQTQKEELDRQEMIDNYTAMIERQYAAMEATLALLQSQSSQIAAQLGTTSSSTGLNSSS